MLKRWWRIFSSIVLIGLLFGLLCAAVVTYLTKSIYESRALLAMNEPGELLDSYHFLRSHEAIMGTIDRLDLAKKWRLDRYDAVEEVRKAAVVRMFPETNELSIVVSLPNRGDARDIATDLMSSYKRQQDSLVQKDAISLEEKFRLIERQQAKVDAARDELLATIRNQRAGETAAMPAREVVIQEPVAKSRDSTRVIEVPLIAREPSYPNVEGNLTAGLLWGFGGALLLSILLTAAAKNFQTATRRPLLAGSDADDF